LLNLLTTTPFTLWANPFLGRLPSPSMRS
jgi:hypothetical protein